MTKEAEVGGVGEIPIFVFARPLVPKIFLENRICGMECPAFTFVGRCSKVDDTLCLEGLSEPNEQLISLA